MGGRYADIKYAHDGSLETAVEVHSAWGTFEWIVRDAFEKNLRVGIVGNSDGHKGRRARAIPALVLRQLRRPHVLPCDKLDRDGIFASMRSRRHYATTGNRGFLDVSVNLSREGTLFETDPALGPAPCVVTRSLMMGDIGSVSEDEVELHIDVVGSSPIERLDIYDGLDHIESVRPYGAADLGARVRLTYEGAEYRGRARTTTWDGSLTLDGNAIRDAVVFNNWNLDRGIQAREPSRLTWKAVTTGNYGGHRSLAREWCGRDLVFRDETCLGARGSGGSRCKSPSPSRPGGSSALCVCSGCPRLCRSGA